MTSNHPNPGVKAILDDPLENDTLPIELVEALEDEWLARRALAELYDGLYACAKSRREEAL